METLESYVKGQFDGLLIVGDVHGDYHSFKKAVNYAVSENFFLLSLGDLVDRGPEPFEVVHLMHSLVYDGRAGMTIGNHDSKFDRYHRGAKVRFSFDAQNTLKSVGPEREKDFLSMYSFIVGESFLTGYFHRFDNMVVVHGAFHPDLLEPQEGELHNDARSRVLFGETTGETYPDGYPVRAYNWIEEVPTGKTVVVGHDKQPIHQVPIVEPMEVSNSVGGKVVFLDTGCGKGGHLTGMVLMNTKKGLVFEEYRRF